jgi:hypothetical protein
MAIPEPITRRMPFWELPTPALADRGIVIVSGIANVSCEEQPGAVSRPEQPCLLRPTSTARRHSAVETRRKAGKVASEHVAGLGSIALPDGRQVPEVRRQGHQEGGA